MNTTFADYATSAAFSLSLTRPQAEVLTALADSDHTWLIYYSHNVPTLRRLERKGLVTYNGFDKAAPWSHSLTEAGLHVAALVKLAGIARRPMVAKDAAA